jgi:hypothetical protein
MKSVEFCYWLQGLFEVAEPQTLNEKQVDLIKRHLNMVFVHEIDQSYPLIQQSALNAVHSESPAQSFINRPPGVRC